jgi:diguanylate cyclase (GGDEF)-like protein
MLYDEARLQAADTHHAVEIAPRIWWVGEVLADDRFQCHVYLLDQGDQSVLFDPGSRLTFSGTLRKIQEVMPLNQIRYFVCHHPDPDITAALPLIDALIDRPDACVVTHSRGKSLLRHYDLRMPFWLVDEHDWRLPLEERELRFIFTPYAHFPGAFCTFDPQSRMLFSSDLFGGFTNQPTLVAQDESHFETIRLFHEHYMPSREILGYALSQIDRFPVHSVAPQHGSIIPQRLVPAITQQLRDLECGIYLVARGNMDLQRCSRLKQTLRDITQTMLLYREFGEIAERLLELIQHNLPARRIDYYGTLEGGAILMFSPENHFAGIVDEVPSEVRMILGLALPEWIAAHTSYPEFHNHTVYNATFCSRPVPEGAPAGSILTLPLFSPRDHRMAAAAVIHLDGALVITPEVEQFIEQLALPLQVAIEREVIYRTMDMERRKCYERSIRDPLTGLFTRLYMQDVITRQCALHDRDPSQGLAALMLDIDHFKRVNDRFGHAAGDLVLKAIATRLLEMVREADVVVRYGGEEILCFLVDAAAASMNAVAERLRQALANHTIALDDGQTLSVTASIGLARRVPHEPLDHFIRRADEALYLAKEGGRNRVVPSEPPSATQQAAWREAAAAAISSSPSRSPLTEEAAGAPGHSAPPPQATA